jgi:hypothetical protein
LAEPHPEAEQSVRPDWRARPRQDLPARREQPDFAQVVRMHRAVEVVARRADFGQTQ